MFPSSGSLVGNRHPRPGADDSVIQINQNRKHDGPFIPLQGVAFIVIQGNALLFKEARCPLSELQRLRVVSDDRSIALVEAGRCLCFNL
jgi:hypothetical protein